MIRSGLDFTVVLFVTTRGDSVYVGLLITVVERYKHDRVNNVSS